jgi:membrane associated rhomboid family serine protease
VIPLRDANPTRRFPVLTIAIIAVCVVAFGWELGVEANGGQRALGQLFLDYGAVPARISLALEAGNFLSDAMLGILTSMFLHGGWLHLIGNMLYLWIFGNNIEDRFGSLGFVAFYVIGGAVAALAQVAIDPMSEVPLVGASGAISAVLGAYLVFFPHARVLTLVFLGFFYQLLQVPALLVLGFWFILQLIDGVATLGASTAAGGVAFFAHIGGFVAGFVVAIVVRAIRPAPPRGPSYRYGVG